MSDHPIVVLHPSITEVAMSEADKQRALDAAFWVTASPHEWAWTREQQAAMAQYVLWASQKLAAIRQVASENLKRP